MASPRILIVEDDRLTALDLERLLRKNGYRVAGHVVSGEQALKRAAELEPDLVLMDIVLDGEMDGISAASAMRREREVPVIFLSAHSDSATLERAKTAGPFGYILKPVRERELYIAMEMALYKHQMEERLRESRQRQDALEQLFENFSEGILILDRDGTILRANAGFENLFQYSKDEVEGNIVDSLIIPPGHSSRFKEIRDELEDKSLVSFETTRMRKSGEQVDVSILALPIRRDGQVVSLYAIYRDVSEQARLQRAVLRTQRLDSIGVLAGGIAHDFNNIIAAVLGNISLARLHAGDNGQVRGLLGRAEQAAVRARDLTGQLLSFSRGSDPEPTLVNLAGVLREALEFCLTGSRVVGRLDLASDLCPVYGDEGQFSQIFNNLVINAKQAMPEGGTVTVTARNRDDLDPQAVNDGLRAGRYVQIMICDTGPGIDEEAMGRIFDPYFTTKPEGSGLGLATVHFLVRRHHGMVTVDSRPGKGTCFTLYFPASGDPASQATSRDTAIMTGTGRILVMDDEKPLQELMGEILQTLGYDPECVGSGDEAVRRYREELERGARFDAVIMDLTVPGGTGGREAMAELLRIDPSVRAIVTSGSLHDQAMENYTAFGFCDRIAKPYRIEELSRTLGECLQGA
jgi:PAS domain S-box-containing protein